MKSISEIVAEQMKKPRIMVIEKGEDPSSYKISTQAQGSKHKFGIGLISKIGNEWLCLYSYGGRDGSFYNSPIESWHSTLRDSKAHFQMIIDDMNRRAQE